MTKNNDDKIQYYTENHYPAAGHTYKIACRINDNTDDFDAHWKEDDALPIKELKDSQFFHELFVGHQNSSGCNYVTAIDSLINSKNSTPYIPVYIPVYLKHIGSMMGVYGEVVGSRLANAFGIDTVFNTPIVRGEKKSHKSLLSYMFAKIPVASVDCVKDGEVFFSFEELGIDIPLNMSLPEMLKLCDNLPNALQRKNFNISKEDLEKVKYDFAKQWFFKVAIGGDRDFKGENIALIINKDKGVKIAPCFDMELMFQNVMFLNNQLYKDEERASLEYLMSNYPDIINEQLIQYHKLKDSGELKKIMDTVDMTMWGDCWMHDELIRRVETIESTIDKISQSLTSKQSEL